MINEHVVNFIRFATDNNELGIANTMFDEKIMVRKNESLRARLYKVFRKDRAKFIRIMRAAGFNPSAENYTTQTNTYAAMSKRSEALKHKGENVTEVERSELDESVAKAWWEDVLDTMVGGSEGSTTTTGTTVAPAAGSQTKAIFVGIGAFIGIGVLVYFGIKMFKSK